MPPVLTNVDLFVKDNEENPVLQALKTLLFFIPFFLVAFIINRLLDNDYVVASILIIVSISTILFRKLLRKGKIRTVTLGLSLFFTLTITVICTLNNGVHDVAIMAYPLVLGFSSIILRIREVIITSVLTVLSISWLVLNENYQYVPTSVPPPGAVGDLIVGTILIVMGALLTNIITTNIKLSLLKADEEAERRKKIAGELEAELNEKNLLIDTIHQKVSKSLSYINMLTDLKEPENSLIGEKYRSIKRRIISIESAHHILHETSNFESINLNIYLPELLTKYQELYDSEKNWKLNLADVFLSLDDCISFGFCFLEMFHQTSAIKKNFANIELTESNGLVILEMKSDPENGSSLDPDPSGILINLMVRQLNGELILDEGSDRITRTFSFNLKKQIQ
ncbi:MAG: hypothetical protein RIM99_02565 [Cyclobacteriaceae bacterium]